MFVKDILLRRRLFCADYLTLNDPLEGIVMERICRELKLQLPQINTGAFSFRNLWIDQKSIENRKFEVKNFGKQPRVCSLSATIEHPLMWAHYADGHRGVAIEFSMAGNLGDCARAVAYSAGVPEFSTADIKMLKPSDMLLHTTKPYEYEQEYRIIQDHEYFLLNNAINAVYFGSRTDQKHLIDLEAISRPFVQFYKTEIDPYSGMVVSQLID